jgi:outer membrane protein TolC
MPANPSRGAVAALLLASFCAAAPAGAVDLEQVLAEVAAANPALAAQQSEVAAARAHARRVGAWDAPMLEISAVNVPTSGGFDQDPMTMKMLGVEQRVDVFGARGLARQAAQGDARAAGAVAGAARWDRFADAWEAYGDAYFSAQRAAGTLAHRAVADRMVAAARARYEVGRGRLDELLRAEAERARLAADGATFDAEERSARARLDALRGREPGARADSLAAPPEWLAADSAAGWRDVIDTHPKLLALREREAARRTAADAARRMVWPELSLHAAYGVRQTLADGTPQDDMWSAGVELMLPLGTGSRQGAEADEMSAMADAAALERRGEALDLGADLATMRGRAAAAHRVVRMLADTVLVAQQRALAAAWSAYESGSTDLGGVLEAAHASYAVELDVTRARQELARTLARLLAVTARADLLGVRVPATAGEGRRP